MSKVAPLNLRTPECAIGDRVPDPTILLRPRSNGSPSFLAPRVFATWSNQCLGSHPANFRVHEISRSLPPVLLRWTAPSPLVASPLATWSTNFGLLPCEPPSSRDLSISATCPPRMDGSDPLVASPLATWSVQLLDFYPANLRAHEIPGSLPPVLLGWTALILSWLRHSRLGASNFWTPTPRTSELTRSPGSLPPVLLWTALILS
jgi:hypothetical protein